MFDSHRFSAKIPSFRENRSLYMTSFLAKKGQIEQKWLLIDATDKVLGRLAVKIAMILMGKNKPTYTPYIDVGDFVIVVNAEKIKVTGSKADSKAYDYFTLYPGGHKNISFAKLFADKPETVLELAVRRMLPKSKLGKNMLKKLHIYRGLEHDHQAQKPQKLEV
jgi:large subunit ribosomal protein L13